MAPNHAIKFFLIANLFKNDPRHLARGENSYTSGHVKEMNFHGECIPAIVSGKVRASMKNKLYKVEVQLDLKKQEILSVHCECPRGLTVCHHMAALLYEAHYNVSSTGVEKSWGVPKASTKEVHTVQEMFGKQKYVAIADTTALNVEGFKNMLGDSTVIGFSWLLKPEMPTMSSIIPTIDDVLFSEEYFLSDNQMKYLDSKCQVTYEQIVKIAAATVGQHKNEL